MTTFDSSSYPELKADADKAFEMIEAQDGNHPHYGCHWTLSVDGFLTHHAGAGCPDAPDSPSAPVHALEIGYRDEC